MACTNIPEALDPALTRPGRFDRIVAVPLPDVRGRQQILQLYLENKPVLPEVDAEYLARNTPGFSGAELFNMVNEAALIAAKSHADAISNSMLDEARDKVLMGSPRKSMVQSKETRRLTAYHEAGVCFCLCVGSEGVWGGSVCTWVVLVCIGRMACGGCDTHTHYIYIYIYIYALHTLDAHTIHTG